MTSPWDTGTGVVDSVAGDVFFFVLRDLVLRCITGRANVVLVGRDGSRDGGGEYFQYLLPTAG